MMSSQQQGETIRLRVSRCSAFSLFLLSLPSPRPHVQLRVRGKAGYSQDEKEPTMLVPDVIPSCTQLL